MPFIEPSEDELVVVRRLRAELTDNPDVTLSPKTTDVTILRFLRGSKGYEERALGELIKHTAWRSEFNVDTIDESLPKFQRQIDKKLVIFQGNDKANRPCLFCFAHRHNASDRDFDEMRLLIIYTLEKLISQSLPNEERFIICFDLSKFSLRCMDFEVVKVLVSILQQNYPDTLEMFCVLDAPMIFSACWAVIKPWLDPVTAHKVQFMRRAQLTEFIDVATIPSFDD